MKLLSRCITGGALATAVLLGGPVARAGGQSPDPSTLPLLKENALRYLGGFRMPAGSMSGGDFTYGGQPIALNPGKNTMYVGKSNYIAEISVPQPLNTADSSQLPRASFVQQAFIDPTEGHLRDMSGSDVKLYGLMVFGDRLIGGATIYYDASNGQRLSHFARSLSLTEPGFAGWSQVWEKERQGYVSGYMAPVPPEWQAALGGPAVTGQCCIPIISRTSYGPSAFAFDPAMVGQRAVPATPLLYYPSEHATLGPWEGQNATYGAATKVAGVAIVAGSRTALFIGRNGLGQYCYGDGVSDKTKVDGTHCYDPTDANKGQHGFPYRFQVWAYDLNDFAAVKARHKKPWDIRPYAVWPLTFPTESGVMQVGGVAYDMRRQIIYVSQFDADRGQTAAGPVIHAISVDTGAAKN